MSVSQILDLRRPNVERRRKASQHFRSFWGAWRTLADYEAIHMIRKGQACGSAPEARGSVCSIAILLVCLESRSDSLSYRTHPPLRFQTCNTTYSPVDRWAYV